MQEDNLIERLEDEKKVLFLYQKKDGSLRGASGTRTKGEYYEDWDESRQVVTYWDNTKGNYRCFKDGNLILTIPNVVKTLKRFLPAALIPHKDKEDKK